MSFRLEYPLNSGRLLVNGNDFYVVNSSSQKVQIARVDQIPTVVNSLTSSSTAAALSAGQGKVLNDRLNLSLYTNLTKLGIDAKTCTIQELAKAVPANSILCAEFSGTDVNPNKPFPTEYGTVICFKLHLARIVFHCYNNQSAGLWCGTYYNLDQDERWSGWKIAGAITCGTESNPSLPIDGLIYLQYE